MRHEAADVPQAQVGAAGDVGGWTCASCGCETDKWAVVAPDGALTRALLPRRVLASERCER